MRSITVVLIILIGGWVGACSTAPVAPPVTEVTPERLWGYPHADKTTASSIGALPFPREFSPAGCDRDYWVEKELAGNKEELFTTFPEHVKGARANYHWCFYWKALRVLEAVEGAPSPATREQMLKDLQFLTHLARVFQADFGDVRYLRVAVEVYTFMSGQIFLQPVRPTDGTLSQWEAK